MHALTFSFFAILALVLAASSSANACGTDGDCDYIVSAHHMPTPPPVDALRVPSLPRLHNHHIAPPGVVYRHHHLRPRLRHHHTRRGHPVRRAAPVTLRGRTKFCSDHVHWDHKRWGKPRKGVRHCIWVRNDLLHHYRGY